MKKSRSSRLTLMRTVAVVVVALGCLASWIGLSSADATPEIPPWVECDTPDIEPHKQLASPCRVSIPDLPDELPVLDVNGEVVGTVDARLLFRPPAPSAQVHENTGDEYHPEDPPLEVFGPSDDVVGIVDNTGFVPEEEIP